MCRCSQEEYDCGLFSIAFATALVFGEQPGNFLFDQKKMRAHLIQCLEVQQITPFPIVKMRRGAAYLKLKVVEDVPVYCLCRMPELSDSIWVECSACKEWYHSKFITCVITIIILVLLVYLYFTSLYKIFARNVWFVGYGKL